MAALDQPIHDGGKLRAPWRNLLLTVHVLATVGVFGADLVLLTLGVSSLLGADPRTVYPATYLIGEVLVAPLAVASLGTGLALALLTPWGVLRYWWTSIKLIITAVLTFVVLLVLVPRLRTAAETANGVTPHTFTTAERIPLVLAPAVASTLLALNVALAVYKPRWRLRGDADEVRRTQPEFA